MEEQRKAMVSDVAHELRTPLSNIRSRLEAGRDGIAVPDQAFMNSLLAEALQLQHIIDDLQDLDATHGSRRRCSATQPSCPRRYAVGFSTARTPSGSSPRAST